MRLSPRTVWLRVIGGRRFAPLVTAHVVAGFGDAMVAVSLAGSLLFSVSPDASRSQVLLYLGVTMAPFAVVAPFVGPIVDRFPTGRRVVAAVFYAIRAIACIGLAATLLDLAFYGIALTLLVANRASGVVKQAIVPLLVDDPRDLVAANSRLSRLAAISGGIGGATGAAILSISSAETVLRVAAGAFVVSTIAVTRLQPFRPGSASHTPEQIEYVETHQPTVVVASAGFSAIRAATGFFVFMLAFTLRRDSEPAWVYAATIGAYGIGSYAGNVISPLLSKRFREEQLMAAALIMPAVFTLFGTMGVTRSLIFTLAAVMGLSSSFGTQAFASLVQRHAPDVRRGRMFARYEARFQLSWVVGALIATGVTLPTRASMGILTGLFVPAAIYYVRGAREALRFARAQVGPDPALLEGPLGPAIERLASARQLHAAGAHRRAVLDAASAADLARAGRRVHLLADDATFTILERLRASAVDLDDAVDEHDSAAAIALVDELLAEISPPATPP